MNRAQNPYSCFLPPHILDKMTEAADADTRRIGTENKEVAAAARATRTVYRLMPGMAAIPSPTDRKNRLVYDMENRRSPLPGVLRRSEEDRTPHTDPAVNEAFDYAGATYDFYQKILKRNSLDNRGMTLISSVHLGVRVNNAFWNGEQMLYGDGDGRLFDRFTKAIDVVAHELTHGVVQFTANLEYQGESGALNESFADVFSAITKQWKREQDVKQADWLLGDALMRPGSGVASIRTFTEKKAYENHPELGTDPQPKHMRDKYIGDDDDGGVHINSGIPNHAFYLAARKIGGYTWTKLGPIWYAALLALNEFSDFKEAAAKTVTAAGEGTIEQAAIRDAWAEVGINT
jgi:Zn-dependent metalloprotease